MHWFSTDAELKARAFLVEYSRRRFSELAGPLLKTVPVGVSGETDPQALLANR